MPELSASIDVLREALGQIVDADAHEVHGT
jgi:hypothetical protein